MLLRSIQKGDSKSLSKLLTNSLELALKKRVREISKIKMKLLEKGALGCLLSGSGSAVFGVFRAERQAKKAARFLRRKKNWKVFVASTF
jgi:4-diphosphocytidyl-2-C-methyl-D-erythritol kinase